MYKKFFLFCIVWCVLLHGESDLAPCFEIKPTYFLFSSSPMKNIYNKGGFEIQASTTLPLFDYSDFYASIGYRKAKGHALHSCEKTNITVIPLDIGLKPIIHLCENVYYFFAMGPRFFYFHQHNDSSYVDRTVNGAGVGLFVNTGFNILVCDDFLLGIVGEYSYEKKKICPKMTHVYSNGAVQLGGFAIGLNVGYAF